MKKLALVLLVLLAACTKREYLSVPVTACVQQNTGRTQEQDLTTWQCFSYDDKGVCTMNIPVTQHIEYREVRVTCDYLEWR